MLLHVMNLCRYFLNLIARSRIWDKIIRPLLINYSMPDPAIIVFEVIQRLK